MPNRCPRLYLVTDRRRTAGRPLLDVVAAALQGGVDTVQLREKDLNGRELVALAADLAQICRRHGARLLINDRVDVALAVSADGVHLPASSFLARDARTLLGPRAIIGVSTHSTAEAQTAAAAGADFIVFGPVFETASKRVYGAPVGLDVLAAVRQAVPIPVVAIGGIGPALSATLWARGVGGIAVIGAILEAPNPRAAAVALLQSAPTTTG
jgi:thiamine-phosphate pyrophosphorylase